ncbi:hypothetical protein J1N35_042197 [Gossypium stocksii]|uniref:FAD dependent oxidoreductase domain-containing protein n=1 Tax=Gossypium stocksii TaxID=47602 RepID=A0A9D3ZKD2_9ROSI|nr:hypothetical protein J1N35_042197 [Gossypium stocksii]
MGTFNPTSVVHALSDQTNSRIKSNPKCQKMEIVEDVVIVGAGIAGLTTSLGLHRLGIRSLVLESSDKLRITGFAFTTWSNAWKVLDAIEAPFKGLEVRCLQRRLLLETLAKEVSHGTLRRRNGRRPLKQFVANELDEMKSIIENTTLECIISSPLRNRKPLELLLWGNIRKANVRVAGDALHLMTPDFGEGAFSHGRWCYSR